MAFISSVRILPRTTKLKMQTLAQNLDLAMMALVRSKKLEPIKVEKNFPTQLQ
jgi:hypothetical protein